MWNRQGTGIEKGNNREILHSNVQCVEKGNNSVEQTREFREDSSAMEPRGEAQGAQVNNYVIIPGGDVSQNAHCSALVITWGVKHVTVMMIWGREHVAEGHTGDNQGARCSCW